MNKLWHIPIKIVLSKKKEWITDFHNNVYDSQKHYAVLEEKPHTEE